MVTPRKKGIVTKFEALPDPLKAYLVHFPKLAEDFPWEVSLSYLFAQIELAQNMIVYCGVVKLHRVDSQIARSAVNSCHMTRPRFREIYNLVISKVIDPSIIKKSQIAETVRDNILHGKNVSDEKKREAIVCALEYANLLNEQVFSDAGFKPFGQLKGFKGRGKALDKSTSRWVLMGIGIIAPKK